MISWRALLRWPLPRAGEQDGQPTHKKRKKNLPGEVNDAVNLELEAIFIAIPKTGTTTVRNQIAPRPPYLVPFPHLNILQVRDSLYLHFLMNALNKNRRFPTKAVLSDADVRAQALATFQNFFKFSSVRNPWARAVSLYFRNEGVKVSQRVSFEEFCDRHLFASDTCLNPTLHRNQIDWITDETGAIAVDYFYKIEEFEKRIPEIRERSGGRLDLRPLQSNVNLRSTSRTYPDLYNDRTRKLIGTRFEKDIDTFGYTFGAPS
jgi:hypothetical protein